MNSWRQLTSMGRKTNELAGDIATHAPKPYERICKLQSMKPNPMNSLTTKHTLCAHMLWSYVCVHTFSFFCSAEGELDNSRKALLLERQFYKGLLVRQSYEEPFLSLSLVRLPPSAHVSEKLLGAVVAVLFEVSADVAYYGFFLQRWASGWPSIQP